MEIENEAIVKTKSPKPRSKASTTRKSWRASRTETEEEAAIRRFHDAQRMARFRARRKKTLEEQLHLQNEQLRGRTIVQDESDVERHQLITDTISIPRPQQQSSREASVSTGPETENKYAQLLAIIERLGRDVRLSYAGSRSSAERLKSGIVRARTLVRDCLIETRLNLRQ